MNTHTARQQITVTPFQDVPPDPDHPECQVTATATFSHADGTTTEAQITVFQLADGRIGLGTYPGADHGTVLRWDGGPHADPSVISWHAPHCADDECGSPCEHRRGRALGFLKRGRRK